MEGQTINIQAIINPISGVGSKRKIPKMIETAFAGENCCVEISFTEYPGHASELTRQALDKGANCVIAVGGDGTVNEMPAPCSVRMPCWGLSRKVPATAWLVNCIFRWMYAG